MLNSNTLSVFSETCITKQRVEIEDEVPVKTAKSNHGQQREE